jgi:hypothetical protein
LPHPLNFLLDRLIFGSYYYRRPRNRRKYVGCTTIKPPPLAGRALNKTPLGASQLLAANNYFYQRANKTGPTFRSPVNQRPKNPEEKIISLPLCAGVALYQMPAAQVKRTPKIFTRIMPITSITRRKIFVIKIIVARIISITTAAGTITGRFTHYHIVNISIAITFAPAFATWMCHDYGF